MITVKSVDLYKNDSYRVKAEIEKDGKKQEVEDIFSKSGLEQCLKDFKGDDSKKEFMEKALKAINDKLSAKPKSKPKLKSPPKYEPEIEDTPREK